MDSTILCPPLRRERKGVRPDVRGKPWEINVALLNAYEMRKYLLMNNSRPIRYIPTIDPSKPWNNIHQNKR